ncbi:SCO2525 family SAM-dependent methyltransferase [Streptomyces caeruleatus]|uniref:Methyltransferase n=1 Tax=Streptomyces caeruleatus TaxID=661399 RepID=A0A101TG41_9ACTN|nr:SCO2525 family SAM-dependent methyltransferase [Streptomyces caeruleatus]KUN91684.1 methyltransferase [Streptomyces caeruleatus]
MTQRSSGDVQLKNKDVRWAAFDPIAYVDHNYRDLQAEDAEILHMIRDHFGGHFRKQGSGPVSGIDVGAGANLYPALAMMPWCDEITLFERSPANVRYLTRQVDCYDRNWDQFWDVLCESEAYDSLGVAPRERFRKVVSVEQGNLFDLARYRRQWSMGTMFFVAESMTTSHQEFSLAVERFLRALAPGAPFAAAFMEHSKGYHTGEHFFPACDVGESEVRASLEAFAGDFEVRRLESAAEVRDGYSGMIVAYGWRNSDSLIPVG